MKNFIKSTKSKIIKKINDKKDQINLREVVGDYIFSHFHIDNIAEKHLVEYNSLRQTIITNILEDMEKEDIRQDEIYTQLYEEKVYDPYIILSIYTLDANEVKSMPKIKNYNTFSLSMHIMNYLEEYLKIYYRLQGVEIQNIDTISMNRTINITLSMFLNGVSDDIDDLLSIYISDLIVIYKEGIL